MFWDKISGLYDLFENIYNHKVYEETGKKVAELIESSDVVLECACGTGAISLPIANKCKELIATDFSDGMLKQAAKKCFGLTNMNFAKADITKLSYGDESFDKVVAGNVIHLLPEPEVAISELHRVVKPGGQIIIPTYISKTKKSAGLAVKFLEFLGAEFKQQFDLDSYKEFFEKMGCNNIEYYVVEGRMPCAIAIIKKN